MGDSDTYFNNRRELAAMIFIDPQFLNILLNRKNAIICDDVVSKTKHVIRSNYVMLFKLSTSVVDVRS